MLQQLIKDLRAEAVKRAESNVELAKLDSATIALCATLIEMNFKNSTCMEAVHDLLVTANSELVSRFDELNCSGS